MEYVIWYGRGWDYVSLSHQNPLTLKAVYTPYINPFNPVYIPTISVTQDPVS
jgi:hypothetical protein